MPYATCPTAPGTTLSAGVGRNPVVSGPATLFWRFNWMPATPASGNTDRTAPPLPAMKLAAAGVERLIWRMIFSRSVVALCVVNSVAATTF